MELYDDFAGGIGTIVRSYKFPGSVYKAFTKYNDSDGGTPPKRRAALVSSARINGCIGKER